jgi:antitoxin component HigA of HigAB toxin-antitoxin module
MYTLYVRQYDKSALKVKEMIAKKPLFKSWLELQEYCENLSFPAFLIMPVQRVPRYVLLLDAIRGILERMPDDAQEGLEDITLALNQVKVVASDINSTVGNWEARSKVLDVQQKLGNQVNMVTPDRYLVKEGVLKKLYQKKGIHISKDNKYVFFLFNDVLIYASKSGEVYTYKHTIPVVGMELADVADSEVGQNGWEIRTNAANAKNITVFAATPAEKKEWMTATRDTIELLKRNQESRGGIGASKLLLHGRQSSVSTIKDLEPKSPQTPSSRNSAEQKDGSSNNNNSANKADGNNSAGSNASTGSNSAGTNQGDEAVNWHADTSATSN